MKTRIETAADVSKLEDIPNIGREIAKDLRDLGIEAPSQLAGRDPYDMYMQLCTQTGIRHDPCVLDTYAAAIHAARTGEAVPWWDFSDRRKADESRAPRPRTF